MPRSGFRAASCLAPIPSIEPSTLPCELLLNDRLRRFRYRHLDSDGRTRRSPSRAALPPTLRSQTSARPFVSTFNAYRIDACPEPAAGDIALTIVGTLAANSVGRVAGRANHPRASVLRRPARYLNVGVPDHERLLARRGIALVGTVKSAALVQVMARVRWFDEWASSLRAAVRRRITATSAPETRKPQRWPSPSLIGDREPSIPTSSSDFKKPGRITSSPSPAATSPSWPA